jgi:hypothetical protein
MKVTPVTKGDLAQFLARGQAAQGAVDHALVQIAYHGPGPTFGELAIGECFEWPPPLPRANNGEPRVKTSETRYEWSRGYGTAEAFYRVERIDINEERKRPI